MTSGMDPDVLDLLSGLLTRHSVGPRHVFAPGPNEVELQTALRAAMRAPDHHGLRPYRFVTIGDERRDRLAGLFEEFARRLGKPDAEVRREGERARNGPVLLAIVARIQADHPQVPPHEQWMCAGGALTNFLSALHMMGYGAKVLSGRKAADPAIGAAFCGEGETLVGWIVIGTPKSAPRPRAEDDVTLIVREWR